MVKDSESWLNLCQTSYVCYCNKFRKDQINLLQAIFILVSIFLCRRFIGDVVMVLDLHQQVQERSLDFFLPQG